MKSHKTHAHITSLTSTVPSQDEAVVRLERQIEKRSQESMALEALPITDLTDLDKRREIVGKIKEELDKRNLEDEALLYYLTRADADTGHRTKNGMKKGRITQSKGVSPTERAILIQNTMNGIICRAPNVSWSNNGLIKETAKESGVSEATIRRCIRGKTVSIPRKSSTK